MRTGMVAPDIALAADGTAAYADALNLSRATLKEDPAVGTLAPLLMPQGDTAAAAGHRLIWHLFAGTNGADRPFLFRREAAPGPGGRSRFLILSRVPPAPSPLFDIETKPFEPRLRAGDLLRFSLTANPTVSLSQHEGRSASNGRPRSKPVDVVMAALHAVVPGERAAARPGAIRTTGRAWLEAQGARAGFALDEPDDTLAVDGYGQHRLARGARSYVATLDFEGVLRVTDPSAFLARLAQGFGRARGFGCGLMLIRRA
jgi:CRISPR system Cascade subunit CasE